MRVKFAAVGLNKKEVAITHCLALDVCGIFSLLAATYIEASANCPEMEG